MLRGMLVLSLIASLLVCLLECQGLARGQGAALARPSCHCQHCSERASPPTAPVDHRPDCGCGSCICKGAVLTDNVTPPVELALCVAWFEVEADLAAGVVNGEAPHALDSLSGLMAPPGRALRVAFCSLQV